MTRFSRMFLAALSGAIAVVALGLFASCSPTKKDEGGVIAIPDPPAPDAPPFHAPADGEPAWVSTLADGRVRAFRALLKEGGEW